MKITCYICHEVFDSEKPSYFCGHVRRRALQKQLKENWDWRRMMAMVKRADNTYDTKVWKEFQAFIKETYKDKN